MKKHFCPIHSQTRYQRSSRQFSFDFCTYKTIAITAALFIEATRKQAGRKMKKCSFCINHKTILNIWLGVESILWIFFFISALYFEIIYINETDVLNFCDETDSWYFRLIFDNFYYLDQRIRSESELARSNIHFNRSFIPAFIILINFMLMLISLTYLIFAIILIYGINWVS